MSLISYAAISDIRSWGQGGVGIQVADASDADVTMYLDIASRRVDDYCGQSFEPTTTPKTVQVGDVRQPLVPLPKPFHGVSQVVADGVAYGSTAASTVAAAPAPTVNAFAVQPGDGSKYFGIRSASVGGQDCIIQSVSGDVITLASPLDTAPTAGDAVRQFAWITEDWGLRLYVPGFLDVDGFPRRAFSALPIGSRNGSPYGAQVLVTLIPGWAATPSKVKLATMLVTAYMLQQRGVAMYDLNVLQVQVEGTRLMMQRADAAGMPNTTGVLDADRMLRNYRNDIVLVG